MAKNPNREPVFTSTGAALGLLVLLSVPLMFWGQSARKENQERRAVQEQQLQALHVPAEPLKTRILEAPAYKGEYVSGGKVSTTYRYWSFVETSDWVLLNGRYGDNTCPHVLSDFVAVNVPQPVMGPEEMDVLTMAFRGKEVELYAHVPRFKQAPAKLENCWGFGFDTERGLLTIAGKPVAVMASKQPALRAMAKATASGL